MQGWWAALRDVACRGLGARRAYRVVLVGHRRLGARAVDGSGYAGTGIGLNLADLIQRPRTGRAGVRFSGDFLKTGFHFSARRPNVRA